jgi:small multidrug resistance family-3 protein
MSKTTTLLVLALAAVLEAGGDALIRAGLRYPAGATRAALFGMGALVLFSYGWTVNAPPWNFGRLLGVYVVLFFAIAQAISSLVFQEPLSRQVLAGGALIVAGGLVIAVG